MSRFIRAELQSVRTCLNKTKTLSVGGHQKKNVVKDCTVGKVVRRVYTLCHLFVNAKAGQI